MNYMKREEICYVELKIEKDLDVAINDNLKVSEQCS